MCLVTPVCIQCFSSKPKRADATGNADLPLTGWTVFPLPLASLGPLCLPPAGVPEALAAPPSPAAAPPAEPGCPALAAANASACAKLPVAGPFDPATDGGVLPLSPAQCWMRHCRWPRAPRRA